MNLNHVGTPQDQLQLQARSALTLSQDNLVKTSAVRTSSQATAEADNNPSSGAIAGSLRDELRRVTSARITSAAEELFKSNGYRATSIQDIVRAAGTTATTFYRHFKSKAELAWVIQRQLAMAVGEVTDKLDSVKTLKEVRSWLDEYMKMWRRTNLLCDAYWEATLIDEDLRRAVLPDTIALTNRLEGLMSRTQITSRKRTQLRLSLLILMLDRVAYLADAAESESEVGAVLDEFAVVMYKAIFSG